MKILAVFGLSYISQLHVAPDLSGLGCPPPLPGSRQGRQGGHGHHAPDLPGSIQGRQGDMGTMALIYLGAGRDVKGAMCPMLLTSLGVKNPNVNYCILS